MIRHHPQHRAIHHGVVDPPRLIDGSAICPGDVVVGLASTGLHSNGYSLARQVLFEKGGLDIQSRLSELPGSLGEVLLAPTRIYAKQVLDITARYPIKGIAHITGGGLTENIPRILPANCQAQIERGSWDVPPIFHLLRKMGTIEDEEMYRVFNMGIGMVLITSPDVVEPLIVEKALLGERGSRIGTIVPRQPKGRGVEYVGSDATG